MAMFKSFLYVYQAGYLLGAEITKWNRHPFIWTSAVLQGAEVRATKMSRAIGRADTQQLTDICGIALLVTWDSQAWKKLCILKLFNHWSKLNGGVAWWILKSSD